MSEPTPTPNLVWHPSETNSADRQACLRQRGCVIWLTGLSGSGKSTIAHALERRLVEMGQAAYVLDGDNIRHGLCRDLGFSAEDRDENIRRIAEVANLFADAGLICISAFISPYRATRAQARDIVGSDRFYEIYVSTSIEECERRDVKGMYRKARQGEIRDFTGVSSPYEPPENPTLSIDTTHRTVADSVALIVSTLRAKGLLGVAHDFSV